LLERLLMGKGSLRLRASIRVDARSLNEPEIPFQLQN
jgi:hypothetical protein